MKQVEEEESQEEEGEEEEDDDDEDYSEEDEEEKEEKVWYQIYFLHRSEYHFLPTAFLYIGDRKIVKVPLLLKAIQVIN